MNPEEKPLVSAIIVNYNAKDFLKPCLESLARESSQMNLEVVVIDNASSDGSEKALSHPPLPIAFIRNTKNIGLARANNQGLRMTRGRYLLFLNPDVELLPGALSRLVRFLDGHPEAGMVGPKLLNPDRSLQYSCREFYTLPTLLLRRSFLGRIPPGRSLVQRHLMASWDHSEVREVDWLLGAFLLIRRETVETVGMMDERFFLYFEDVDWCFRMRKAGWKVYYLPEAEAIHYHYRHSARKGFRQARDSHIGSLVKFVSKYGGLIGRRSRILSADGQKRLAHPTLASRSWPVLFGLLSLAADLVLASGLFWLDYLSRFLLKPGVLPHYLTYFRLFWMTLAALALSLFLSGFYRNASRLPIYHQIRLTLRGALLSGVVVLSLLFLIRGLIYSRFFLLLFWAALLPFMILERYWLYKLNLRALGRGYGRKRTWIYGEDKAGQELYERFLEAPELGCEIVGFLSNKQGSGGGTYGGLPVFPTSPQILKPIVQREGVEQILVPGLNPVSLPYLKDVTAFALENDMDLRLVHPRTDFLATQTRLFDILGISLVSKRSPLTRPLAQACKRMADVLTGFSLLVMALPWFAGTYILLKLRGVSRPVQRVPIVGRGEREVLVHGFVREASLELGHLAALPALWEVVTGTLSLVGPKALSQEEVLKLGDWERRRFKVAPGLTGLAQVRSSWAFSTEERMLLDLYYIENWSPLWDIEILLETPAVVFLRLPHRILKPDKEKPGG
jgi:GT2 family glycosyltransferase/lipopolysaccharide/colanic/teichoic acid biosynthesis glycosyltransferase